jgi:hypothetical protein
MSGAGMARRCLAWGFRHCHSQLNKILHALTRSAQNAIPHRERNLPIIQRYSISAAMGAECLKTTLSQKMPKYWRPQSPDQKLQRCEVVEKYGFK